MLTDSIGSNSGSGMPFMKLSLPNLPSLLSPRPPLVLILPLMMTADSSESNLAARLTKSFSSIFFSGLGGLTATPRALGIG